MEDRISEEVTPKILSLDAQFLNIWPDIRIQRKNAVPETDSDVWIWKSTSKKKEMKLFVQLHPSNTIRNRLILTRA